MSLKIQIPQLSKRVAIETWVTDTSAHSASDTSRSCSKRKHDPSEQTEPASSTRAKACHSSLCLTKEALKQFTRQTSSLDQLPDILRMCNEPSVQASGVSKGSSSTDLKSFSADHPDFGPQLRRRKVYDADAERLVKQYPINWDDIQRVSKMDQHPHKQPRRITRVPVIESTIPVTAERPLMLTL